jgi:hypothetical protein
MACRLEELGGRERVYGTQGEQRAPNPVSTPPATAFGTNRPDGSVNNGTLERS